MQSSNTFAISQPVTTGASQTKFWSNAANTASRLLALFPISLFTFQAREAYLTPIKNVKDGLGASHARFDTAMAADTWDGMLKDMPSSVQKAQRAAVWMLCGAMTIFQMLPQGPFQLCMVLIAMICVAAGYHTAAIGHFAQSLARSGLPDDWTHHDEEFAATFLAFILWRNIMAFICAVFSMMTYNMNPIQIYNLLQSPLPGPEGLEMDSPQTVATSLSTPTWMYITAGCILATLMIQCAVAQRRLNMLLRSKDDLEKYGNKGIG